eukprot:6559185-Pyramimonas_sp.AAC.1
MLWKAASKTNQNSISTSDDKDRLRIMSGHISRKSWSQQTDAHSEQTKYCNYSSKDGNSEIGHWHSQNNNMMLGPLTSDAGRASRRLVATPPSRTARLSLE